MRNKILFILLMGGLCSPVLAQESILKDFAESRRERKYALYPSTLRMINIGQNKDYNALVNDVDKILIYSLDSATRADRSYQMLADNYGQAGFEEYARIFGGDYQLTLLGKEAKTNEFYGLFGQNDAVYAFHLKGNVAWQKIISLINNYDSKDFLLLTDLKL